MKVAVFDNYGPPEVVKIKELAKPKIKPEQILVKVVSSAVTAGDSRIRGARFPKGFGLFARLAFGLTKPRNPVLGSCFSGVVEQVGSKVDNLQPGDEVCGMTGIKMGCHSEFIVVNPKKSVAKKPKQISHEDAAGLLFGGTAGLYFIRNKAGVSKGQKVLVNGASGAVGTNAVQLAKYFGAEVTAVTSSANSKLLKSLGADKIIDYQKTNFLEQNDKYDVVLDTVGNINPRTGLKVLKPRGKLLLMVASLGQMFSPSNKVITGTASEKSEDIEFLLNLVAKGELKVVIDKVYSLNDIAQAHARTDSGQKVGNIIIKI